MDINRELRKRENYYDFMEPVSNQRYILGDKAKLSKLAIRILKLDLKNITHNGAS